MQSSYHRECTSYIHKWLLLNNIPNIGYLKLQISAKKLNCSFLELLDQSYQSLSEIGWSATQIQSIHPSNKLVAKQYKQTCDWLLSNKANHFLSLDSDGYPPLLKQIARPPLFLFVTGNVELLSRHQVAFVGSRNASRGAVQMTHDLIKDLAIHTQAISVSGLALGVDAACHQASLANNLPTIGVLGCGVDVVYPKRHRQLFAEVISNGALVSEFLLGTQPVAHLFPRRNRIISGMSLGTVVVEAQIKSGSLVTAKYANEQNREVFAIPSNVANPNAQGCHWLIKQGAKLTENVLDIVEELPHILLSEEKTQEFEKSTQESLASDLLLDNVDYTVTSIDLIAARTGMAISDVLCALLEYELRGLVASTAEGYIKIKG